MAQPDVVFHTSGPWRPIEMTGDRYCALRVHPHEIDEEQMSRTLTDLAPLMELRPTDTGFRAQTFETGHGAIFGAYLLFQQVLAAERAIPGKRVLSLQTIFANGGRSGEPIDIVVETLQEGRSFASVTLSFQQDGIVVSRALALMTTDEDDFLRHQSSRASTVRWQEWPERDPGLWPGTARQSPNSSLNGLSVRLGLDEPVTDPSVARALVALCSEPEVITSFIRFGGVPDAPAGRVPGNVLTQTVTLLEPVRHDAGVVLQVDPTYSGQGRSHGSGLVTDEAGRLLATFSTTGVLRAPRPA